MKKTSYYNFTCKYPSCKFLPFSNNCYAYESEFEINCVDYTVLTRIIITYIKYLFIFSFSLKPCYT